MVPFAPPTRIGKPTWREKDAPWVDKRNPVRWFWSWACLSRALAAVMTENRRCRNQAQRGRPVPKTKVFATQIMSVCDSGSAAGDDRRTSDSREVRCRSTDR